MNKSYTKNIFLLLFISLTGYAQKSEIVDLNSPLFSFEKHTIVSERTSSILSTDVALPVRNNSKKKVYVYELPILTEAHFKRLTITKNKSNYDLTIKMNGKGKALFDKYTTENLHDNLVYVVNDTAYAIHKIKEPNLTGEFFLKGLTKSQKNNFISYLKSLPKKSVQEAFFKNINFSRVHKLDSLVKEGAWVIDGPFTIGPNYYKNVIRDAYRDKDTIVTKFLKRHNFKPVSHSINDAYYYKDTLFVKDYFKKLKKTNSKEYDSKLNRAYYEACRKYDVAIVKTLVAIGADINYTRKNNYSAFENSAAYNTPEVIRFLFNKKVKYDSFLPLFYAAFANNKKNIDCLLDLNFDINATYKDKSSLLQELIETDMEAKYANYKDAISIAKYLIIKNLDVKTKDEKGNTLLHTLAYSVESYSTFKGQHAMWNPDKKQEEMVEITKLMIAKGANPTAKNNDGLTPLAYAKSKTPDSDNEYYKIEEDKLIKYLETLE